MNVKCIEYPHHRHLKSNLFKRENPGPLGQVINNRLRLKLMVTAE